MMARIRSVAAVLPVLALAACATPEQTAERQQLETARTSLESFLATPPVPTSVLIAGLETRCRPVAGLSFPDADAAALAAGLPVPGLTIPKSRTREALTVYLDPASPGMLYRFTPSDNTICAATGRSDDLQADVEAVERHYRAQPGAVKPDPARFDAVLASVENPEIREAMRAGLERGVGDRIVYPVDGRNMVVKVIDGFGRKKALTVAMAADGE